MLKFLTPILFILSISFYPTIAQIKLVPNKISLKDGREFSLNLPSNYEIIPAVEGLKRVRFFARSPEGRIFVTDMFDMNDNRKGTVYVLDGWDAKAGKFSKIKPFLINLRNPNSIAFYTDKQGQDWFYLAETDKLTRRKYVRNSDAPTADKRCFGDISRLWFELQIRKLAYDAHFSFFTRRKTLCFGRYEL